jgi:hypothetical protein
MVVVSGGGLHAYWPFTRDLSVAQWKPLASALKALCKVEGLHADPTVTTDAARILRIPGTHNHKPQYSEPPLVSIAHSGDGATDPDTLRAMLPVIELPPDLSAAKAYAAEDTTTAALAASEHKPAKFMKLVRMSLADGDRGCAQIRNAVVNAATLAEPEWRAALSIAWNCVDAEKAIHKLSSPHPGYTAEDTLEKAQRLTGKPHTCAWYKDNYPAACGSCKHKITSPIQLGVFVKEAPSDGDNYVIEAEVENNTEEGVSVVEVTIPKYQYPYFRGVNGGVFKYEKDADGDDSQDSTTVEVYAHDLYVTGRFYDTDEHGDGEGELVGVNLHLPHDGIRRFHVPIGHIVARDRLRDALAKQGVLAFGKQLDLIMGYLASSIKKLQSSVASARTRSQMGWTPEWNFVVGEFEYTPNGVRLAPPASGTRQLAGLFQQRGSLEEWRQMVNFYNRPGMESHAFAFLVGAGSPLLKLLNSTQVRGAVLNLVSNASGTGKTTAQMLINSMFGHPSELLMEARDTSASRFHRLGTLNSICMTVDELTNADPLVLSAMVYGSSSGRGAHRMEAQGNRLRTNHATWCSITVTSSNAVMADVLLQNRSAIEGELKRVIDLRIGVPENIPKAETDELFSKLDRNYGIAGPILIQHVIENRESISEYMQALQLKIDREAGFERSDRFYSAICTVAFTVAHIGNQLGLWELDIPRIYKHAVAAISGVKETNHEAVGSADVLAMETLAKYLSENLAGALVMRSADASGMPPAPAREPRAGLKYRYEPDNGELIIPVSELKHYFVDRRVDVKSSLMSLLTHGVLAASPAGELSSVRRPLAGVVGSMAAPSVRCYVFNARKLGCDVGSLVTADVGPQD